MKIEMGESLMLSYLKHVLGCQIIQTNWKPSPTWSYDIERGNKVMEMIDKINEYFKEEFASEYQDEIKQFFGRIKNFNNGKMDFTIFKQDKDNNVNLEQLLSQGECDLIGIYIQGEKLNAYAAEVAYHSKGLGYGAKDEAIMKVAEKMLRAVFDLYLFFEVDKGKVIFASPVVKNGVLEPLMLVIKKAQDIFNKHDFKFELILKCNDEFKKELLEPLIPVSADINDTSELFLRSYQLEHLFDDNVPQTSETDNENANHSSNKNKSKNINHDYYLKAKGKIKRWAEHPKQINYKIIRSYFKLADKCDNVTLTKMKKLCRNKEEHPDMYIPSDDSFKNNYSQMKIDGAKSHGKVFVEDGGYVHIWPDVKNELMKYKEKFCS